MRFDKYLTPEERVQAWRNGFTYKLAEHEILPSEVDAMMKKEAQEVPGPFKALLYASLLVGAPIGIIGHLVDQSIRRSSVKTKHLTRKRDFYRDLTTRIKQELEAQHA